MQVQVPGSQEPLLSAMAPPPQTLQTPCSTGWGLLPPAPDELGWCAVASFPPDLSYKAPAGWEVAEPGPQDLTEEVAQPLCGQSAVSVCAGGRPGRSLCWRSMPPATVVGG